MFTRREALLYGFGMCSSLPAFAHSAQEATAWPPALPGARNGTVTLTTKQFLEVPAAVQQMRNEKGVAPFVVAKAPPTVDLAFHRDLGPDAISRRLWSSWGDICVASDGRAYCGIGDHGNAVGGDARCFIYRWDPKKKVLEQVVDMNRVVPPQKGQPAWSKVHARIDEGPDGKIYFSCTLNDGNRAIQPTYGWTKKLPGGQLYQFDPKTGKTSVFADLVTPRCSATSILDRARNVWWCNLEGGNNALWGLDLKTKQQVFKSPEGAVAFNRNFALGRDGSIYFNGEDGRIGKYDAEKRSITLTKSTFPDSPGMRSSTRESKEGVIYGTTHKSGHLFRYTPAKDELRMLGPAWMTGDYVTVSVLSPDEKFVYYLPGAHGKATRTGTPVLQYNVREKQIKVLAFLAPAMDQAFNYVPGGTYGVKISADGATLYVNFNGHAGDAIRPKKMRPNGFGLCSFAAIHIPDSER